MKSVRYGLVAWELLLLILAANASFSQKPEIDVLIHSRVDTSDKEIKAVAELWINYLNSEPDSVYDNPYWNLSEKSRYKKFDFSVSYLYQFPSKQLLRYYKPTILSIEKEQDFYSVKTLFLAEGLKGDYRKSNPWCITKLYAVKENGAWKLKNALPIITKNWNRRTIGKITFVYPDSHQFNEELAAKANLFCDSIAKEYQFTAFEPFEFYVTDSGDELGRLLNFDFFFAGYTKGIGMNENRMILSGKGTEYYPHEFVHLIVPPKERHWMIDEGFATWKGGQGGKNFEENAGKLANEVAINDTLTFSDVLNKKWGYQISAAYTTGAILCNAAYKKGGVALVRQLLDTPDSDAELTVTISRLLGIKIKDLDAFWRAEVLKFANKYDQKNPKIR